MEVSAITHHLKALYNKKYINFIINNIVQIVIASFKNKRTFLALIGYWRLNIKNDLKCKSNAIINDEHSIISSLTIIQNWLPTTAINGCLLESSISL